MANLLRSTSGSITLFGQALTVDPLFVPLHVGYMPQHGRALNNLTVGEALYFTAHLRGLRRTDALHQRDALLVQWQIEPLRDVPTPRLSGGQQRLMQIAVAMAGNCPVLILDEPTTNLDPQRRRLAWDVLRQCNAEFGTTIIFITRDAIEAEKIIQRVGIMRAGELVAVGRPADLKRAIGQQLRLELFFSPDTPPTLPSGLVPYRAEPGRWLVLLKRRQVPDIMACLSNVDVDDFQLYSATLEDLYLHYAAT